LMTAIELCSTATSLAIAYGWWRMSTPDPALTGTHDGGLARKLVRVCVALNVAFVVANTLLSVAASNGAALAATPVLVAVAVLATIVSVVAFFAQMVYIRWLAPRLPNAHVRQRAKTLMWLGPLLYTVGALLLVGPLIALVLYWNMLDKVRADLREIRDEKASNQSL